MIYPSLFLFLHPPPSDHLRILLQVSHAKSKLKKQHACIHTKQFKPAKIGDSFGPAWATFWLRFDISIPKEWEGKEVHFIFDADCEGLIWENGVPMQGLTGGNGWDRRAEYVLTANHKTEFSKTFYLEMACNGMFGVGRDG